MFRTTQTSRSRPAHDPPWGQRPGRLRDRPMSVKGTVRCRSGYAVAVWMLLVLAAPFVACDKSPAGPTPQTQAGPPTILSLVITGPDSSSPRYDGAGPAIALRSDQSSRNVTNEAAWRTADSSVLTICVHRPGQRPRSRRDVGHGKPGRAVGREDSRDRRAAWHVSAGRHRAGVERPGVRRTSRGHVRDRTGTHHDNRWHVPALWGRGRCRDFL